MASYYKIILIPLLCLLLVGCHKPPEIYQVELSVQRILLYPSENQFYYAIEGTITNKAMVIVNVRKINIVINDKEIKLTSYLLPAKIYPWQEVRFMVMTEIMPEGELKHQITIKPEYDYER